jgi:hypothetical protein
MAELLRKSDKPLQHIVKPLVELENLIIAKQKQFSVEGQLRGKKLILFSIYN